jgi:hypothetical protein
MLDDVDEANAIKDAVPKRQRLGASTDDSSAPCPKAAPYDSSSGMA